MKPLIYLNALIVVVGTLALATLVMSDGASSSSVPTPGDTFVVRNLIYSCGLVVTVGTLVLATIAVFLARNTTDELNRCWDKRAYRRTATELGTNHGGEESICAKSTSNRQTTSSQLLTADLHGKESGSARLVSRNSCSIS